MTTSPSASDPQDDAIAAVEGRLATLPIASLPESFEAELTAALRVSALTRRWRRMSAMAAAIALVAGGVAGALLAPSAAPAPAPADPRPEFMLIFDEQVAGRLVLDNAQRQERGDEMNAWIGRLRAGRHLVSGRKLRDEAGQRATPQGVEDRRGQVLAGVMTSGFVIIRAVDYGEAARLAQASPIVAHGGTIAVRALQ